MLSEREETPGALPEVTPRDLHPVSDIRFVMREIGALVAKVDRLIGDIDKATAKLDSVEKSVIRFKTAILSVGFCLAIMLPAFGGIFWWAIGERINTVLQTTSNATREPPPTAPPRSTRVP